MTAPAGDTDGVGIAVEVDFRALEEGSGSPVRATLALSMGAGRMSRAILGFGSLVNHIHELTLKDQVPMRTQTT